MKKILFLLLISIPVLTIGQDKCAHKNVICHAYFTNPPYYESVCSDCGKVLFCSRKSFAPIAGYKPVGMPSNFPKGKTLGEGLPHPTQLPSTVKAKKIATHTHKSVSQKISPQTVKAAQAKPIAKKTT